MGCTARALDRGAPHLFHVHTYYIGHKHNIYMCHVYSVLCTRTGQAYDRGGAHMAKSRTQAL